MHFLTIKKKKLVYIIVILALYFERWTFYILFLFLGWFLQNIKTEFSPVETDDCKAQLPSPIGNGLLSALFEVWVELRIRFLNMGATASSFTLARMNKLIIGALKKGLGQLWITTIFVLHHYFEKSKENDHKADGVGLISSCFMIFPISVLVDFQIMSFLWSWLTELIWG